MRNGMRALLMCAAVAMTCSTAGVVAAPPVARSFAAGYFVLEIDGIQAGFVSAVEGGLPFGDVIKLPSEDFFFKKQLANPGVRDIRLETGAGMDKSFYSWIALALQGQPARRNGAILTADFNGNVISRLEFQHALITEVGFPALDAGSKEPAHLSIVLTPDHTSLNRKASGKVGVKSPASQKKWLSSNFRLLVDGLNTTKVSKIDALTIKLPRTGFRDDGVCRLCEDFPPGEAAKIDFPHVIITLAESSAQSVYDWFEDFVVAGNNDDAKEKNGTLEFLTPDLQTTLFTLKLKHLGIFELMPVMDSGGIARLAAALYCESMELMAQ